MTRKKIFYGVMLALMTFLISSVIYTNSLITIITGYAAKNLGSAVFVSHREPANVETTDLNFSFIRFAKNSVNYNEKSVTSHFLWGKSKAIYRDGFGVTLLRGTTEETLRRKNYPVNIKPAYSQDTIPWPLGNIFHDTVTGIDRVALDNITKRLINDNAYKGNAFAFMVLYKGIPVAEAYKPQFNQSTRFISWSMAKSFTNAMVGILVKEGKIDINKPVDIEEWKNDERRKITLNNLMQMQSGLKWNENYGNRSDVTVMLHCESDMSHFAVDQPLEHQPGSFWYYSSGTSNIVTYLIRKQFSSDTSYYAFAHTQLLNKAGMPDAVFEVDPSGTLVGSSYLYATARDFARFGLLYLNDGVFNGERILPEGWVKYTTSAASASKGEYGAFFWLNKGKKLPSVPEDMFMCNGHDGQRIFIIPSEELVVVVLGFSPALKGGMDFDRLLKDIISTI
ncbi:MAG: beta-lactamase family protein [Bacteroidales bacterium]|nr:beta-lactamase family protein [Bacteroidales bacterium]